MEEVLSKLVQHSVNYAIRSGIAITSGYAIKSCSRLLKSVKGTEREEIADLQARLESKINIISPPIDMIELIAARGNTSLESALSLTKQIRMDIQNLGVRLNEAAADEERIRRKGTNAKNVEQMGLELKIIIIEMKRLLVRIEDAVPLLMLAITTSGASLSTMLPASVSPSRLLQASTFLSAGDANYASTSKEAVQVGPVFVLSVYMLFAAHALRPHHEEGISDTTWKEVIRKARVKLIRVPLSKLSDVSFTASTAYASENATPKDYPSDGRAHEFAYQLMIVEDLDDDRFHEEAGEPFDDVQRAGIREVIPIHEVSKIFYADTGKLLKIGSEGEPNNPILLIKRDTDAVPPRRMMSRATTEFDDNGDAEVAHGAQHAADSPKPKGTQASLDRTKRFPRDLDPEWIALEVYTEAPESDEDEEDLEADVDLSSSPPVAQRSRSTDFLSQALSSLRLRSSPAVASSSPVVVAPSLSTTEPDFESSQLTRVSESEASAPRSYFSPSALPALRTSLSLLELIIRLTALQQFQQASHLTINDEFLNFFLSGSSSTGAGADSEYRKRVRRDARLRVGFDPYDESPIKQRGEAYLDEYNGQHNANHWDDHDDQDWQPWQENNSPRAPTLQSPQYGSPSPSLRRQMQRVGSMPKGRSHQLRQELGEHARSPLGRSESDSTLGTSPRTSDDLDERK